MGTTGLIYAAIVAVWAAYLVPLWLRRHDEESANRSAERFSSAMRVLAKRQQTAVSGGSVGQSSEGYPGIPVDGHEDGPVELVDPGPSPATRRRRVLVGLLAVSTVFAGLAAVDLVPWWSWYISLVVAVGFLGLSAWIASGERASGGYRSYASHPSSPWYPSPSSEVAAQRAAYATDDSESAVRASTSDATESSAEPVASDGRKDSGSVVAVLPDDFGTPPRQHADGTWDPVEVPLPRYVTQDTAPRTGRKIQIGDAPEHRSLLDESHSDSSDRATTGIRDELYDREQTGDFDDLRAVND